MTGASARDRELAQWLFEREAHAATDANADGVVLASEAMVIGNHLLDRMRSNLSRWFGADGFNALMGRALNRTRPEHPVLARMYPQASISASAASLIAAASDGTVMLPADSTEAVTEAVVAATAEIIALLVRLVGEDMATRLVRQIWPETASQDASGNTGPKNERIAQ